MLQCGAPQWCECWFINPMNNQRKLGSNTSELRMTFTWWNWLWWRVVREWDLTLVKGGVSLCITWQYRVMKGGARVRLDLDEGWCEPLHYMTIQQKRTDLDEGWCETLHYITIHQKRTDLDEGWCETLHYITIHEWRTDFISVYFMDIHGHLMVYEW